MKIAELYAALKLHVDNATFKRGDDKLKALGDRIAKFGKRANEAFGRGLNAAALGVAGAIGVGAREALKFDKALTALYLSSDRTMGSQVEMRQAFLDMSSATGVAKESLVEAAQAYVALTGDGAGATEAVRTFARVATASGSSLDDVSGAAAALREQFGIMPAQMEQAFSILVAGGKAGKIELKDMASLTASLAAGFKSFGGSQGLGGAATLGALFQATAKDAGGAAQAATNLENLFAKIKTRRAELAKIGVKVENGKVGSNDYKDIVSIVEMMGKAKSADFSAFNDAFGSDMQANAALDALSKRLGLVRELIATTQERRVIAEDLAVVEQSAAFRASKAWNDAKLAMARAFTPERVEQIASLLTKISSAIVKIIDALGGAQNAVIMLAGAFAVLKAFQVAGFLTTMATQLAAMGAAGGMAASGALAAASAFTKLGVAGAALGGGYLIGNKIAHGLNLHEGDAGYHDDYADPRDPNAKRRAENARRRRLGLPVLSAMANPSASVSVPGGSAAAGGSTINADTVINVTSGAADPVQVAREVRRAQEAVNRDAAAALAGG